MSSLRSRLLRALLVMAPLLVVCSRRASDQDSPGGAIEIQEAAPPGPVTLPAPPLSLSPPLSPSELLTIDDRPGRSARSLFNAARSALRRDALRAAVHDADASVRKGGRGHLLLARAHARLGELDGSFYWLQRAALEEGVDPRGLEDDDDLAPLRADPRWPQVEGFLQRASAYWATSGRRALLLIAPTRVASVHALPLVVGLHDDGDEPGGLLDEELYRRRARQLGVVFVGVSGAVPLGPLTYRWSTDAADNARHVGQALDDLRARAQRTSDQVILLGFSEGAQAAVETAGLDPERYRGAIALSPRSLGSTIAAIAPHPGLSRQRYVIALAQFDSFDAVGTAYIDADRLRGLGASVDLHTAWLYGTHALPPDYDLQLPRWIDALLGRRRGARSHSSSTHE